MTVDASEPIAREDHPDWTDPVEALGDRTRAVPASAFRDDGPDARECGVYGWWADDTARRLIEDTLRTDASSLIYVGKTTRTLARRVLGNHIRGSGKSTLRRSLAAILMTDSELAAGHPDPRAFVQSRMLSDWMRKHLQVAIIPVDLELVEDAEQAVIAHYDPPLNGGGPRTRLTELRKELKPARDAGKRLPLQ